MASLRTTCRGRVVRFVDTPQPSSLPRSSSAEMEEASPGSSPLMPSTALTMTTFTEVLPGVFLLASVNATKNQCVIELVKPEAGSPPRGDRAGIEPSDTEGASPTLVRVPPTLQAALRVPRIIHVMAEEEGVITTIELVTDRVGSSSSSSGGSETGPKGRPRGASGRFGETARDAARSPLHAGADTGRSRSLLPNTDDASALSLESTIVHLFIGTTKGTVLVCNALRGTIVAMAQFQYHHEFHAMGQRSSGVAGAADREEASPTAQVARGLGDGAPALAQSFLRGRRKVNEAVVRFVVQERGGHGLLRNPDLIVPPRGGGAPSSLALQTGTSHVAGVYAVHDGGRVVLLGRDVLDIFVSTVVNRLDGQRPYFALEWSPTSSLSSYPVAGPASRFAPLVKHVYTLRPVEHFSENERRTLGPGPTVVRDAAFLFAEAAHPHQMESVLRRSVAGNVTAAVLVCGVRPALALYPLEEERASFSAVQAVKAVTSRVAGMARSLWYGGGGSTGGGRSSAGASPSPQERLEKKPQDCRAALLEGDTAFTRVVVDPTMQAAAFYAEGSATPGAGRVYLCDAHTGVVWRVLKGCRSAAIVWWLVHLAGRSVLLLVVHLPQRGVVEVHAVRRRQRLAACYVPVGAVLLRPSAGGCITSSAAGGCSPTLLTASGELLELSLDLRALESAARAATAGRHEPGGTLAPGKSAGHTDRPQRMSSVDAAVLRSCLSPDDYLAAALQLRVPQWTAAQRAEDVAAVRRTNVDAFRCYQRELRAICGVLQRRYAPSYTEPRVIRMVDDQSRPPSIPRGLGAAQALHYIEQRGAVVAAYARLALAATSPRRSDGFGSDDSSLALLAEVGNGGGSAGRPASWDAIGEGAGRARDVVDTYVDEAWSHCVGCPHRTGQRFWDRAMRRLTGLLSAAGRSRAVTTLHAHGAEWSPATAAKTFTGSGAACEAVARARVRPSRASSTTPPPVSAEDTSAQCTNAPTADPMDLVDVDEFLSWFRCGGARVEFRRAYVHAVEEATGRDCTGALAALFYGRDTFAGFLGRFEVAASLGLDLTDLAALTLAWLAGHCAADGPHLLATLSLGRLWLALAAFPGEAFVAGLERVLLPVWETAVSDDVAAAQQAPRWTATALAGAAHGLLLCCAARLMGPGGTATPTPEGPRFVAMLCQLTQMWKAAVTVSPTALAHAQRALLPPPTTTLTGAPHGVDVLPAGAGESATTLPAATAAPSAVRVPTRVRGVRLGGLSPQNREAGDSLEAYVLRRGLPLAYCTLSTEGSPGLVRRMLAREDTPSVVAKRFPFAELTAALLVCGAEYAVGRARPTSVFTAVVPWIGEGGTWRPDVYAALVTEPVSRAWAMVACGPGGGAAPSTVTRTPAEQVWKVLQQCAALLSAVACLQEGVRPLGEAVLPFWTAATVPDVNLFALRVAGGQVGSGGGPHSAAVAAAQEAGANWLVGSRSHRDYLTSLSELAQLTRTMADALLGDVDEVRQVHLIQAITSALAEDDNATFPLVPRCLWERLHMLMQLLGQHPEALLLRVRRVTGLLHLLLLLVDVGSLTVDGRSIDVGGLAALEVPWVTLFGESPVAAVTLFPDPFHTTPSRSPSYEAGGGDGGWSSTARSRSLFPPPSASASWLGAPTSASTVAGPPLPDTRERARAAAALVRAFLIKCVVPEVQRAALVSGTRAVDPQAVAALTDGDTKVLIGRLCRCLDLGVARGDLPALFIIDCAVKHLCPTETVSNELVLVSDRGSAARVAASDLRGLLGSCVKFCAARRRYFLERQDRTRLTAATEKMDAVLMTMSDRCKQWIQRPRASTGEAGGASRSASSPVSTTSAAASAAAAAAGATHSSVDELVLGGEGWVTPEELHLMDRFVVTRLSAPSDNPQRADFFALLFLLAQLTSEGRAYLSTDAMAVAPELPGVIDSIRRIL